MRALRTHFRTGSGTRRAIGSKLRGVQLRIFPDPLNFEQVWKLDVEPVMVSDPLERIVLLIVLRYVGDGRAVLVHELQEVDAEAIAVVNPFKDIAVVEPRGRVPDGPAV